MNAKDTAGDLVVGMVLFPDFTQLDLTGPYEVFARTPGVEVELLATSREAVRSEQGLGLLPDATFGDAPNIDILFVPGGTGVDRAMEDDEVLHFLDVRGAEARYVTSVCTGSLVLGAAGLLKGYRAACHWLSVDLLTMFGATPTRERVVRDRNRITGGGITAGIDFGLVMAAELRGESVARSIQLIMEYDPAPPFDSGTPDTAEQDTLDEVRATRKDAMGKRTEVVKRASSRLTL